jgi:dienelactone hydrolase
VDSLSPRGLYRHNTGVGETDRGLIRRLVGAYPRALDALSAAAYLAEQLYVQDEAIAVFGMSQGGQAMMQALAVKNPRNDGHLKAGVALYPACDQISGVTAPTLVQIGEKDQWISLKRCHQNFGPLGADGKLELLVYPEAHHVFDYEAPDREVAGRPPGWGAGRGKSEGRDVRG